MTTGFGRDGKPSGSRPSDQATACPDAPRLDPSRSTYPWRFEFYGQSHIHAREEAVALLTRFGFSVGRRQRGAPSGVMLGDYDIQKWCNLRAADRKGLHGRLFSDHVPVTLVFDAAPPMIDNRITQMNDALLAARQAAYDAGVVPPANAIAMEARRAATPQSDAVHDSAGPKDIAQ